MRYGRTLVAVAALLTVSACEDSFSDPPVSWECLRVKSMVDLTSSMPISEALALLEGLVVDPTLTDAEREYATAMRDAVAARGDGTLGDTLDDVTCTL